MRVLRHTDLPCAAEQAWNAVQTSALLLEVAKPLVVIRPVIGGVLPERWPASESIQCRSYLFGLVPLGTRTVYFERIDPTSREIQTREKDVLVPRWDHLIRIQPLGVGLCRYSDEVEIEAGIFTLPVWLFARWFYWHRQRRWSAVARRLQVGPS